MGGFAALEPLTPTTLVTGARIDLTAAILTIAAAALYAIGVRRLARRGRRWSPARSLSFATGIVMLLIATQSGLAAYDTLLFSAHVAQHVLLGVVAPLFLALGAPVTLALQASHRPTQVNLLRVLRSLPVLRRRPPGHGVRALLAQPLRPLLLAAVRAVAGERGRPRVDPHPLRRGGFALLLGDHRPGPRGPPDPLRRPAAHRRPHRPLPRLPRPRPAQRHPAARRGRVRRRPGAARSVSTC